METTGTNSETLKEVSNFHAEMKSRASKANDLPAGAAPIETAPSEEPAVEASPEAPPAQSLEEATPAVEEAPTLIKIGSQTFTSQAEAIKYAESLEAEKLTADAYAEGMRHAIERVGQPVAPPPPPPVEEDFDAQFYSNPKEYLTKVKEQAKNEALGLIKAEQRKEQLWRDFFREYPDLDGQQRLCELTLNENWEVLGKMTDLPKAMKILATKTRAIFQDYNERTKPRTELPNVVPRSVSGAPVPNVTPQKKVEAPLDFASQLRTMKKRS